MAKMKKLSEREQLVLYGLVRYPHEPDSHTAKDLGMPQPTFSNIQRRLKKQGYYNVIGIPDLEALGCEIITVLYGTYSPLIPMEKRAKLEEGLRKAYPEIFFSIHGVNRVLLMLTGEDFVAINKAVEDIGAVYIKNDLLDRSGLTRIDIHLPTAFISRFFDYSTFLYRKYGLKDKTSLEPWLTTFEEEEKKPLAISDLNMNERRVLHFLMRNPESADVEIAMKLKISRTTVSKIKNRLVSTGLFRKAVIPNISKVDSEIMAFAHSPFTPGTTFKERMRSTKWLLENIPVVLSMITNKEAATLFVMEDYHDLQELKRMALFEYQSKGFMDAEPDILVFSSAEVSDMEPPCFDNIIKKTLGL
jgi:DNA-binding MarR family transcriptional regulator